MTNFVRGEDIYKAFETLNCCDLSNIKVSDFDWVCDVSPGVNEFLSAFIEFAQSPDLALTDQELQNWAELKSEAPDSILHGKFLTEALSLFSSDDCAAADQSNLCHEQEEKEVIRLRDELDMTLACLHEMETSYAALCKFQASDNRAKLLTTLETRADAELKQIQEDMIDVVDKENKSLVKLLANINTIIETVSLPQRFLFEMDWSDLEAEDKNFLDCINSIVDREIKGNVEETLPSLGFNSWESSMLDLIRSRSVEETTQNLTEINERLMHAYSDSEGERIFSMARLEGRRVMEHAIRDELKLLEQGIQLLDINTLRSSSMKLEGKIKKTENEVFAFVTSRLKPCVVQSSVLRCQHTLALLAQIKLHEQKHVLSVLEDVKSHLLAQLSHQELLGLLLEFENNSLNHLVDLISETTEMIRVRDAAFKRVQKRTFLSKESVSLPIDFMNKSSAKHDLSLEQNLQDERERRLKSFSSQHMSLAELMHRFQSQLHNSSSSGDFVDDISSQSKKLQVSLGQVENSLKNLMSHYDQQKRMINGSGASSKSRKISKLWIDFLNDPKLMAANFFED